MRIPRWMMALAAAAGACAGVRGATGDVPRANGPAATPLAVEQALEELKSGDWLLKWAAMSQLARWGVKDAAPQLKAVLAGRDHPWVRGRALVALAELLGEEVLAEAQARAKDGAAELRAAAVEALGILGSPRGEAAIAERLKDPAAEVRYQAIVALARVRREAAWDTVAPLLDDADPLMVQHAARALVYVGRPEGYAKAVALLGHAHAGVRAEAAATLRHAVMPEAIPALLQRMGGDGEASVRAACEKALAAFEGGALLLPMLSALRGEQRDQYRAALRVLALKPTREACDGVAALVREPGEAHRDVLPDALALLARLDPDRYLDIFVGHLKHASAYVRCKAIECVAKCKGADQYALLRPMLVDTDRAVRVIAFRAVREIPEAAPPGGIVDYLAEALQQGDKWTHRAAVDLLCERVPPADLPKAIAVLAPVLGGKERDDRNYVAKALARLGDEGTRRLIALAEGYVTDWALIGPFPYDSRNKGYGPCYFPEHEVDFAREYEPFAPEAGAVFKVAEATCGGEKKKGLVLRPPPTQDKTGRLIASFRLELPETKDLKLTMALGLEDGAAETDGVQFEVHVNGLKLFERQVLKPEGWQPAEVSLADFSGKKVAIEVVVDPLASAKDDQAAIGEPTLVSGEQALASLADLADSAPVRVARPDAKARLAWQRWQATRTDGEVPLYDIFPPPLESRIAYGVADVTLPREQKGHVWVKSDDGFILWLNGVKIAERPGTGEQKVEVTFRQGPARFLIKTFNLREWWLYHVRLTDPEGRAIELRQESQ